MLQVKGFSNRVYEIRDLQGRVKPVPWKAFNRKFTLESIVFGKFLGDCSCLVLGKDKALKYSAERALPCAGVVVYRLEVTSVS